MGYKVFLTVLIMASINSLINFGLLIGGYEVTTYSIGYSFLANSVLFGILAYGVYHGNKKREESE